MRNPDIFVYRGAGDTLDLEMHPVRTQFYADPNMAFLKGRIDAMGANLPLGVLHDLVKQTYESDDTTHRAEVAAAKDTGMTLTLLQHLNQRVLDEVQRRLASGAAAFHNRFVAANQAFLDGKDTRFDDVLLQQRPRMFVRNEREQDMTRFM